MTIKRVFWTLFLLFFSVKSFAQLETSVWYFGRNAGLDFKTPEPTILLDGALVNWEGVAAISDSLGNLCFYTDGRTVWNREHQVMQNGDNLLGNKSSTESAIIVPLLESDSKYYIFVVDDHGNSGGLSYSLVDMNLDNGNGAIVSDEKNIIIENPVCEKVTAIRSYDNKTIWLLTKSASSDKVIEWKITKDGLDLSTRKEFAVSICRHDNPQEYDEIIANLNDKIAELKAKIDEETDEEIKKQLTYEYNTLLEERKKYIDYKSARGLIAGGYMRISPNGRYIACATMGYWEMDDMSFSPLEVFKFDPNTGVVSSYLTFYDTQCELYGVEFSNDASKLYYASDLGVFQIDLSLPSEDEILNSVVQIGTYDYKRFGLEYDFNPQFVDPDDYSDPAQYFLALQETIPFVGALQLSTNGKIYCAQNMCGYLGVINNPREKGEACDFQTEGQYLGGKISCVGLPNFIPSYFLPPNFEILNRCSNSPIVFNCTDNRTIIKYEWVLSDLYGNSIEKSSERSFEYKFLEAGKYRITLTITTDNNVENSDYRLFEVFDPPQFELQNDTVICYEGKAELRPVKLENCEFTWSDDYGNEKFYIDQSATIYGTNKNIYTLCEFTDDVKVEMVYPEKFTLGDDIEFCSGGSVDLKIELDPDKFVEYQWLDNQEQTLERTFEVPGKYILLTKDYNKCDFSDTILVKENPLPDIDFSADSLFCTNLETILDCKVSDAVYLWSTGETSQTIVVKEPGKYWVDVTDSKNCFSSDTVFLKLKTLPEIDLPSDTTYCEDDYLSLDVFWNDATEYVWNDFINGGHLEITSPGQYILQTRNACGVVLDTIDVTTKYCGDILIPNIITPNGDDINDYFKIKGLTHNWSLQIFSREGVRVFKTDNYQNDWNAPGLSDGVYFYILEKNDMKFTGNVSVFHRRY